MEEVLVQAGIMSDRWEEATHSNDDMDFYIFITFICAQRVSPSGFVGCILTKPEGETRCAQIKAMTI